MSTTQTKPEVEEDSMLRLRVHRSQKGRWVAAARQCTRPDGRPGTLHDWVTATLDAAASNPDDVATERAHLRSLCLKLINEVRELTPDHANSSLPEWVIMARRLGVFN